MIRVLMEAAGNPDVGMGHVLRSIELARHLRETRDVQVSFLCDDDSVCRRKIAEAGFVFANPTENSIDVWLVDRPRLEVDRVAAMTRRRVASLVVALDYFHYDAPCPDLIINLYNHGSRLPGSARIFYAEGFEFAIIRKDLRRFREKRTDGYGLGHARGLLVMFGGSDPQGYTLRTLEAVKDAALVAEGLDVVLGPQFSKAKTVADWVARRKVAVQLHRDPADLPSLMARSALAISNGATTMLELMYLGVPAVVMPQSPEEERFARRAESLGAVRCLELQAAEWTIARALSEIHGSPQLRQRLSDASKAVVDGMGVQRISDRIFHLLRNRRDAPFPIGS